MSETKQAFVLVTIPNASLTTPTDTLNGELVLQYVDVPHPGTPTDVVLILKLDSFETPIDPRQPITQSTLPSGDHEYIFHSTPDDPTELLLTFPTQDNIQGEIETLHSVLADYGNFRGDFVPAGSLGTDPEAPGARAIALEDGEEQDLRGRFVLVNENNGEVIGALDDRIRVREDPTLAEKGHENDPVVVEIPEDVEDLEHLSEEELIVRSVPPEQRDWMMKSAVFFSGVISGGTSLVESAMTSASKYYISHSTPEPHSRPSSAPADTKSSGPSSTTATPPPSRTLLFLQSPTTHTTLSGIHTASGHVVALSNKTAALVDGLLLRLVGSDPALNPPVNKGKAPTRAQSQPSTPKTQPSTPKTRPSTPSTSNGTLKPPLPPRSLSASPAPPAYSEKEKPPLPPRKSPTPSRPVSPAPPVPSTSASTSTPALDKGTDKPKPLRTRTRIALSAALVLASLSSSADRLATTGGTALSAAVTHKYGETAGHNVGLAAGTVRNAVLVYVDVRGFGRRAIVKRAGAQFVKGQVKAMAKGKK